MISDGTFLYGTTTSGGVGGNGTIFKIKSDGSNFTKILDLDYTNTGTYPKGDLVFDGAYLYALISGGGIHDFGTIVKVNPDGTGATKMFDFDRDNSGSSPYGSLVLVGSYLYGTCTYGGANGQGTLFRIKPDGTAFEKFLDFNNASYPQGSLISDGTFLYGVSQYGGVNDSGTLFKTTITPFTSISNFTPAEGVIGTYVTINGINFDPTPENNVVKFNGVTAPVKSATSSSLTVIVPAGTTTGPISVAANTSASSSDNFTVTSQATLADGIVQNCNTQFVSPSGTTNATETFLPVTPGDKVKISFTSFSAGDILNVYDGPSTSSPLIASLTDTILPGDIVASGPGGELTFEFVWQDSFGSTWLANISCVSSSPSISIDTQPSAVYTVCEGGVSTIGASASGTTNISYQWQELDTSTGSYVDLSNTAGYSGVSTSSLTINSTGNFGTGTYRCKISGDFATTVYTNTVSFTVNALPAAPVAPDVSNCGPGMVTLTATGGSNGQYIWYDQNGVIPGETNSTYTTPLISTTTSYSVAVTNGTCVSAKTNVNAVVLTTGCATITISQQPVDFVGCPGEAATFSVSASGTSHIVFQWQYSKDGAAYADLSEGGGYTNVTTATMSVTTGNGFGSGYYRCKISGDFAGSVLSQAATLTLSNCSPPTIATQPLATQIGGKITLDLRPLIQTAHLDLTSLQIVTPPSSGASASIDSNGILTIDYQGKSFAGEEQITIKACDENGQCSTQDFQIEVAGDIVVYNGISPGGANPKMVIEYIDIFPETRKNKVYIFDRWENLVWEGENYDNSTVVFSGQNTRGGDLPSGVYFYKIDFSSGKKTKTGFIALRRQ